jgi:hypothetical protein
MIDMRVLMLVLTAVALLLVTGRAEAGTVIDPEQQFMPHKHPNIGHDYYVVRKGESDKCSIVKGSFADKPVGAVGATPYATIKFAKTALESSPECKGGLADDDTGQQTHGKKNKK